MYFCKGYSHSDLIISITYWLFINQMLKVTLKHISFKFEWLKKKLFDQSATRAIGVVLQSLICSKLNKSLKQDTWFIIYTNLVRCRIVLWLVKYLQHVIIQKCESISIIIFVVFHQNISYCAINGIFNFNWNWINRIRVKACTEKTIVPHERQHNLLQGNFHLMGENWSNKCQSLNKRHKNFAICMFYPFLQSDFISLISVCNLHEF